MVFSHIEDFLELKKEAAGLGFWCEQSFESCHHDFKVSFVYVIFLNLKILFFRLNGRRLKLTPAILSLEKG